MPTPSRATADRWNNALQHFRFHFAHGGHANDMDLIVGSVSFARGEAGLLDLFDRLEVPLERITPDMPRRELGKAYSSLDTTRYADPIPAYPSYQSPKLLTLFGAPASLSVLADEVVIYLAGADGDIWSVTEADFRNALRLEKLLPERGVVFAELDG